MVHGHANAGTRVRDRFPYESGSWTARPELPQDHLGQTPNAPPSEALFLTCVWLLGSLLWLRPGELVVTSPTWNLVRGQSKEAGT